MIAVVLVDQGTPGYATDTQELFARGEIIVTDGVPATGGNWVCEEPYVPGSVEDRCRKAIPDSRFAVGPWPVFSGVPRPGSLGEPPSGREFFGFGKHMEGRPADMAKVMSMVETLAFDKDAFLLGMFGIEGKDWIWRATDGLMLPAPAAPANRSANTGPFWILPFTPLVDDYTVPPRVAEWTRKHTEGSSAYFGRSAAERLPPYLQIPPDLSDPKARDEVRRFDALASALHERYYKQVFLPVVTAGAGLEALDAYRTWYHQNGGQELEEIANRWARS